MLFKVKYLKSFRVRSTASNQGSGIHCQRIHKQNEKTKQNKMETKVELVGMAKKKEVNAF